MRHRWLYVVLAVSLALNFASLGAFGYHRWREHSKQRRFFQRLQEGAPRRLKALYGEHEERMQDLREQYRDAQEQLYGLMASDSEPDSAEVEKWLERTAEVRKEMHRLMFESARKLDAELSPEDRERIHRNLSRMYRPERRSRRPRDSRGRHRHEHWDGLPPGPPPDGPPPEIEDEIPTESRGG